MAIRTYFFTGTGAPTTTPSFEGSIFVDTTADTIYFATGTASAADWTIMPSNLSDLTQDADHALAGLYKIKKALGLDFQPSLEATIATGVMTQVQSLHSVDTESDAASDDLDTITALADMNFMLIKLENSARVVTLKHGTGNLLLPNDADVIMKENVLYLLVYNGSDWNLMLDPASIDEQAIAAGTDNDQTGTSYTLVLADANLKTVWMDNAASNTLTVPPNSGVAFIVGTKINIMMEGAGVTTILGDTGVIINGVSAGSVVINNQYQGATITKRATDTWIVSGDIT